MQRIDTAAGKKKIVSEYAFTVKRPMVGVSLGYPLYDEVKRACDEEPVKLAAFVLELVRYGWRGYRRVGSLKALKAECDVMPTISRVTSKRISEERCAILAEALNVILERGNSAIIEAVERYLIDKAGRYGGPRA